MDLKEQLFGWSTPISADEHEDDVDDQPRSPNAEAASEEPSQSVPKRLTDLRNQLENKKYALAAAKEASTFDKIVGSSLITLSHLRQS